MILIHLLEGGEGSGNFDHGGRPGQVGGSQPRDLVPVKGIPDSRYGGQTPEDFQKGHPSSYINWEIPEKQYFTMDNKPLLEEDPNNPNNVLLYHATSLSNFDSIMEKGLIPHLAGVLKKDISPKIFLSYSEKQAGAAYDYEYRLKKERGVKVLPGDVVIFKVSVPKDDIQAMRNGDIRVYRKITPNEFVKAERWSEWQRKGFTYNNSHRTKWSRE